MARGKYTARPLSDQAPEFVESHRTEKGIALIRSLLRHGFDEAKECLQDLVVNGVVGGMHAESDSDTPTEIGLAGQWKTLERQ